MRDGYGIERTKERGKTRNISCLAREDISYDFILEGTLDALPDDPDAIFGALEPFIAHRTDAGRAVHASILGGQRLRETSNSMWVGQSAV